MKCFIHTISEVFGNNNSGGLSKHKKRHRNSSKHNRKDSRLDVMSFQNNELEMLFENSHNGLIKNPLKIYYNC